MRRLAVPLAMMTLAGCSGFGQFTHNTFTLPGANPDLPGGASETMLRVQAKPAPAEPLEVEGGNVWPGAPKPFPTLGEVEKQTENGQTTAPSYSPGQGAGPSQAPSAFDRSNGQTSGSKFKMESNPNAPSTITIPNGNGTSTVIAPDGSVKIVPTPKDGSSSGK